MPLLRLCLIPILTLGGCATYRADPLHPGAELDRLRRADLREVVERRPASTTRPAFNLADGLNEDEVVAVALAMNPDLRARRAAGSEAEAALITAGVWPNPELGIGVRPGIDGASGTVVEADALFQLLRPGERDARKKAARADLAAANAEQLADEYKLVAEVRHQLLAVLAAEREVALLQEAVELQRNAAGLVTRQRQIGEATELSASITALELAESQRELRKAQADLATQKRSLGRLLGLPPDHVLNLTDSGKPLPVVVIDDPDDAELDRRLLSGRPELAAKLAAYEQAEQSLRLAVLQQYPKLGLGPAFEKEMAGEKSLGIGLSLELPLFDRNQGGIAAARAKRSRVGAEYVAVLHHLRGAAFEAREALRVARAEIDTQEKDILPLLRRNQELFEGAYRARELNVIDWITAQERSVRARREYLEAMVTYRKAVIDLETATGPTNRPN